MDVEAVELWVPRGGVDGAPDECLLGVPLLQAPGIMGLYRLVSSSVWTPLTWGDVVNARGVDELLTIESLAASGPHTRLVVAYDQSVPRMTARAVAQAWAQRGAVALEALPGLFITAWAAGMTVDDAVGVVEETTSHAWHVLEAWASEERTGTSLAAFLTDT
ncbi:MAG: hypothetical protein Q4G43_02110 [Mobilicoccus sp.]|nr:hypothetical protein [Mobilicoccus sp.]